MAAQDRIYFAQRAAEEQELAQAAAGNPQVAEAHRKLQRVYLERASTGERPDQAQRIG